MFAAHHKVDNLISTVDWNGQQIDGPTDKVMSLGNIRQKFDAFGWTTLEMNGNDMDDVVATLEKAKSLTGQGKPIGIMMHTEMGKGVDFMEGSQNGMALLLMMNNWPKRWHNCRRRWGIINTQLLKGGNIAFVMNISILHKKI